MRALVLRDARRRVYTVLPVTDLRARRRALGISTEQAAEMVGVSRRYLNRVEVGDASPSAFLMAKLDTLYDRWYTVGSAVRKLQAEIDAIGGYR